MCTPQSNTSPQELNGFLSTKNEKWVWFCVAALDLALG